MANYTMQLWEIVAEINLFDFDYPIDKTYKPIFEEHFINFFFFDEIGVETVERFKLRLKNKLNLIMPYWNKVIAADKLEQRILDNYNVTETYTRNTSNNVISNNSTESVTTESDTPVTRIDLEKVDYFSNILKSRNGIENNVNSDGAEKWERKMVGNIGVQTDADAIIKYYNSLRKIEIEIFMECEDLFMGVY